MPEYEYELYEEEGELFSEAWDIMRTGGMKIHPSLEGFKHLMDVYEVSPIYLARSLIKET